MTKIRIDPLIGAVRFYKNPVDGSIPLYKMTEPYYKSFPIQFLDDGSVRITLVVEAPAIKEKIALFKLLKEMGYIKIHWRHKDKEIDADL